MFPIPVGLGKRKTAWKTTLSQATDLIPSVSVHFLHDLRMCHCKFLNKTAAAHFGMWILIRGSSQCYGRSTGPLRASVSSSLN